MALVMIGLSLQCQMGRRPGSSRDSAIRDTSESSQDPNKQRTRTTALCVRDVVDRRRRKDILVRLQESNGFICVGDNRNTSVTCHVDALDYGVQMMRDRERVEQRKNVDEKEKMRSDSRRKIGISELSFFHLLRTRSDV